MNRQISYSEIADTLTTGDLILFHGKQETSLLIELLEWSYWSHVGMVVLPKDIGIKGNEPLIWESTSSGDGIIDVILGKEKPNGPMLIPLKDRISVDINKDYDNHFKVIYLHYQPTQEELNSLKAFIDEAHDASFPQIKDMLKIYLEGREKNIEGPKGFYFCSQLASQTYMQMGFLSKKYVDNGYCPSDFLGKDPLPLTKKMSFSDGALLNQI